MIEINILSQKFKEFKIREYLAEQFMKTGYSYTKIQRTPLGDKIIIYTTRPGLVVGRKGENIKKLTSTLKKKFKLENPQIELGEVANPFLDSQSIAEKIAYSLEKFGPSGFKSIGYKTLQSIMDAGALGAEIIVAGKIPSSRSRTWRFVDGYLKKCGHISDSEVIRGESTAHLRTGAIGISVSIMPPTIVLPDTIKIKSKTSQEDKPTPENEVEVIKKVADQKAKVVQASTSEEKEKTEVKNEEVKTKKEKQTKRKAVKNEK